MCALRRSNWKHSVIDIPLNQLCISQPNQCIAFLSSCRAQQKLKSTALVTTSSLFAFAGISVYKNNEHVYNNYLMPLVRLFPPEFCHRIAVLGFKYRIFPKQFGTDAERLVRFRISQRHSAYIVRLLTSFVLCLENPVFRSDAIESSRRCSRFRQTWRIGHRFGCIWLWVRWNWFGDSPAAARQCKATRFPSSRRWRNN